MDKKRVGVGVGVMIVKDNKILLGLRHDDPEKADSELRGEGTWSMPGGGLEYGETPIECAIREVEEETGIKVKKVSVMCVNNDMNVHAHFITIGTIAEEFEGEPQVLEPDEIVEWRWFNFDALPKNLFMPSEKILENFKQKKFFIY